MVWYGMMIWYGMVLKNTYYFSITSNNNYLKTYTGVLYFCCQCFLMNERCTFETYTCGSLVLGGHGARVQKESPFLTCLSTQSLRLSVRILHIKNIL